MPEAAATTTAGPANAVDALAARAEELAYDVDLHAVAEWKAAGANRHAVGYMPTFVPREVIAAAGVLPVAILGGGDRVETIRGDAYYQSYICHIPRSTIELAVSGRLDVLSGMIFPAVCDVIRNLSGMWQMQFDDLWIQYFDYPQLGHMELRRDAFAREFGHIRAGVERLTGAPVTDDALRAAIAAYDDNRTQLEALFAARRAEPWRYPASEVYVVVRAGSVLPVEAHNALIAEYLAAAAAAEGRHPLDNSRVVIRGAFCEQPPLALIRTLERAGCDIVDDDFLLGARWLTQPVGDTSGDPWEALATAYAHHGSHTASYYTPESPKGAALVEAVQQSNAEGVIFCAASFCDPALLDQPMLVAACDAAGIPHTAFKYSEDAGQFQVIREQAGTFADSIRLWGGA